MDVLYQQQKIMMIWVGQTGDRDRLSSRVYRDSKETAAEIISDEDAAPTCRGRGQGQNGGQGCTINTTHGV